MSCVIQINKLEGSSSYQNEDLQEVQRTRFATGTTALIMSLQLVPGQNLNWGCERTKSLKDNWLYMSRTLWVEMWARTKSSAAKVSQLADMHDKPERIQQEIHELFKYIFKLFLSQKFCRLFSWNQSDDNRDVFTNFLPNKSLEL